MPELQIPTAQLKTLLNRLKSAGGDQDAALRLIGLDRGALSDPVSPLPLETFGKLNTYCENWSGDPLFSLHAALFTQGEEFTWARYALVSQPVCRDLIQMFVNISREVISPVTLTFEETPEGGEFKVSSAYPSSLEMEIYSEFCLGLILNALLDGFGIPVQPMCVHIGHASRAKRSDYEEVFGRKIKFQAGRTSLEFSPITLALPMENPNPALAELALDALWKDFDRFRPSSRDFSDFVLRHLQTMEGPQGWKLASFAAGMKIPPRTLQYRLTQCGTSFQLLADLARREKASLLLGNGLPQKEIAYELGYADDGSLRKAFLRWFGTTPGRWGEEH